MRRTGARVTAAMVLALLAACSSDDSTEPPAPLLAPEQVAAVVQGTAATVTWSAVASAQSYRVQLTAATQTPLVQDVTGATTAVFQGLTPGVTYSVTVAAIRGTENQAGAPVTFRVPDPRNDLIASVTAALKTSLHGTSKGMQYWYERGDGFRASAGVNYSQLGCPGCHVYNEALTGVSKETPCLACHAATSNPAVANFDVVDNAKCMKCHSRQASEVSMNLPDVHRAAGMKCEACHTAAQVHGSGSASVNTMFDELKVECVSCHKAGGSAPAAPTNTAHSAHGNKLACQTCHMSGSVTCYNCHFKDELAGKKTAYAKYADWVFLGNYRNQVYPLNFQSVEYEGKTFNAWGPFHGHTITQNGRSCNACHGAPTVAPLVNGEKLVVTRWDAATGTMTHLKGVIPVPATYHSQFQFDYVTKNATGGWSFVETGPDASHMLYATPLTASQMNKLISLP